METKHATGSQMKMKRNFPKYMGHSKEVLRGKFMAFQAYLRNKKNPKLTM